jgi:hypothetical protein
LEDGKIVEQGNHRDRSKGRILCRFVCRQHDGKELEAVFLERVNFADPAVF